MRRNRLAGLAAAAVFLAALPAGAPSAAAVPAPLRTVIGKLVIGHSARGRAILAYHLGTPGAAVRAVVLGQIHGDEHAGVTVAEAIVHGRPVTGIDLWVIPTLNPDGKAANTRANAHGVDLNRNWPNYWAPNHTRCYVGPEPLAYAGGCNSGPRPLSEPETRAMYAFLKRFRPTLMVSIHQPLDGVDTTDGGSRKPGFRHRLARNLGLPETAFVCWSVCRGSMTGWITNHQSGAAITVEFGYSPSATELTKTAPSGIIAAFGGRDDTRPRRRS